MLETSEPGILDAAAGFHYRWWDMRKSQTFVSQDPDPISCKAPEESHNKAQVGAGCTGCQVDGYGSRAILIVYQSHTYTIKQPGLYVPAQKGGD